MTKRGIWRLTVTEGFCASHCLRGYEGPCENLHGHNFGVEVVVEGRIDGDGVLTGRRIAPRRLVGPASRDATAIRWATGVSACPR